MQYLRSASIVSVGLLAALADAVPVTDSPDAGSTTSDIYPPASSMLHFVPCPSRVSRRGRYILTTHNIIKP